MTRRLALLLVAVAGAILRTLWREARALREPVPAVRTWRVPNPYVPDTASTDAEPGGGW